MNTIQNPEWLKYAASDARFSSKEVSEVFGYKCVATFFYHVEKGDFPRPDYRKKREGRTSICFWKAKTIKDEMKRRSATQEAA